MSDSKHHGDHQEVTNYCLTNPYQPRDLVFCNLMCYAYNKFPEEYIPTVFETYITEVVVDEQPVSRKFAKKTHSRIMLIMHYI